MRELTSSELQLVSGGLLFGPNPISLDATGLNIHLVFGPVAEPVASIITALLGIGGGTHNSELRIHLGAPVTPAPINFV